MSQALNRTVAPQVIRFFYLCFQRGVLDAYELGSDIDAKEFYEQKISDWTFGTLSHPDMDWRGYRAQLYWWAREHDKKSLAEGYIFKLKTLNYAWCLLPYCMRFYLMGVSEWLAYPNPGRIEYFKQISKGHWDPNSKIKDMTRMDIISYLHTFEFDYARMPEGTLGISKGVMSSFIQALYTLSRQYVTKKKKENY